MVFYAPPKVMLAKKQKHYQTTVYKLFEWIRKVMSQTRGGTTKPLLVMSGDLNDDMGNIPAAHNWAAPVRPLCAV